MYYHVERNEILSRRYCNSYPLEYYQTIANIFLVHLLLVLYFYSAHEHPSTFPLPFRTGCVHSCMVANQKYTSQKGIPDSKSYLHPRYLKPQLWLRLFFSSFQIHLHHKNPPFRWKPRTVLIHLLTVWGFFFLFSNAVYSKPSIYRLASPACPSFFVPKKNHDCLSSPAGVFQQTNTKQRFALLSTTVD